MALVALLAVIGVVAAAVGWGGAGSAGVARAVVLLEDLDRFDTAMEAGDTLAEVGEVLQLEARRCRDGLGEDAVSCEELFAAAAYAQVLAAHVLGCTAPGRHEARTALLAHLLDGAALRGLPRC